MKKSIFSIILLAALCLALCTGCGGKASGGDNSVTIWTSAEDYRIEYYLSALKEKFPDYNITIEYMNTSSIAAKVMEEGNDCSCDILLSEEYSYLYMCQEYLAELPDFDYSVFLDEYVPENRKFTPETAESGSVIINPAVLAEKGLPTPTSYDDLLDPAYKGLISMPSPTSSGTGYMFLRLLTNEMGEDAAFEYFEALSENILQYTSSGSGPVNALVQGEVAIGLGMTAQAVVEINDGVDLEIVSLDIGSPYNLYGNAVLASSAERQCVMDVFNYLATDLCRGDNERFFPEQIYKDFIPTMEGFPADIQYGNMSNNTLDEKERLLDKWTFS